MTMTFESPYGMPPKKRYIVPPTDEPEQLPLPEPLSPTPVEEKEKAPEEPKKVVTKKEAVK